MAMMEISGSIRGRTVVLEEDPGLPDGQAVSVRLTPGPPTDEVSRAALLRSAGAWAEDAEELDGFLEWNRQQRKINRLEIEG
jgi:hypothetical protein